MNCRRITAAVVFTVLLSISAAAQVTPPQGRLSLSSTNAVMTGDVNGATTIYYLLYPDGDVPLRYDNGGVIITYNAYPFAPKTLNLNSSQQLANNVYDIFAFFSGPNTTAIGIGPAWASLTSRGTGSGSTAIQQDSILGVWMNTNGITLYNGTNSYSINGGYGTYLGSVYMTGNGQTTVNMKPSAAAGGSANVIGIWNAYNRVTIYSLNRDSNTSWTDTSAAWEMADTSDLNRVTWVDGLQQTSVRAYYAVQTSTDTNVSAPSIGVDLNSTSATPNIISAMLFGTASDWNTRLSVEESFPPQLGANYVQAMQNTSGNGATFTFYGIPAACCDREQLSLQSEY